MVVKEAAKCLIYKDSLKYLDGNNNCIHLFNNNKSLDPVLTCCASLSLVSVFCSQGRHDLKLCAAYRFAGNSDK